MDDAMMTDVLEILSFAPMIFILNGYWLIDNKLFFNNSWAYKMKITDNSWSTHLIEPKLNQAFPMLYLAIIFLFVALLHSMFTPEIKEMLDIGTDEA